MRRRILAVFLALSCAAVLFTGCMGRRATVSVVVTNATTQEIRWLIFQIPPSFGTYSPMKELITGEDTPLAIGEEREISLSFVEADLGNSGLALIGLQKEGGSDNLKTATGEVVLLSGVNRFTITQQGEAFAVLPSAEANTAVGEEPAASGYTLVADFSGGTAGGEIQIKVLPLPQEESMPASQAVIALFLADALSEWTGLDFTLNDVRLEETSITVDWAASSTLIAGLEGREQKDAFRFYDGVSLNWFMMDSLAATLKQNLPISTVYYSAEGGPVQFQNQEDMAQQGLPKLPTEQPYEGSAFFATHAGGKGEVAPKG